MDIAPHTDSTPPEPLRPAGFWIRAAAHLLDGFIVLAASVVVALVAVLLGAVAGSNAVDTGIWGGIAAATLGSLIYMAVTQASPRQASLGKRAMGLTVTDRNGSRLTFGRSLARELAKILNGLTFYLGWLLAAVTARKQALHDFVAGTVVVRQPGPAPHAWAGIAAGAVVVGMFVVGIGAAILIPGLLRARMAGNEASAIGALRAISSAQASYFAQCGGYAISLTALGGPTPHVAPHLSTADTVVVSGYSISMNSAPGSTVGDTVQGCLNATTGFVAQAAPQQHGTTGLRYFVVDAEGTIYQSDDAAFSAPRPVN
jgi:uncharacterized RDD family membrane protein YckC/type II secretory pathway pseudopilin PulG